MPTMHSQIHSQIIAFHLKDRYKRCFTWLNATLSSYSLEDGRGAVVLEVAEVFGAPLDTEVGLAWRLVPDNEALVGVGLAALKVSALQVDLSWSPLWSTMCLYRSSILLLAVCSLSSFFFHCSSL